MLDFFAASERKSLDLDLAMMIMDAETEAAGMAGGNGSNGGDGGDGDGEGYTAEEQLRRTEWYAGLSKTRRRVANCTTSKRFNILVVGLVICDVLISLASLTLSPYLVKDVTEAKQVPSLASSLAPSVTPSLGEEGHTSAQRGLPVGAGFPQPHSNVSDPQRRCYDGHQPECHREPLDEFEVPGERGRGGEGGGCV